MGPFSIPASATQALGPVGSISLVCRNLRKEVSGLLLSTATITLFIVWLVQSMWTFALIKTNAFEIAGCVTFGRTETRIQDSGSQAVGGSCQLTTSQDTPRDLCIKTQDKLKLYKMQAPYIRASLSCPTMPENPPPLKKNYFLCSVLYPMYVYLPSVP